MDPVALVRELAAIEGRAAGTDAERRAARLLARRLRDQGREPRTETFWTRPAWALVHAVLCAAGVAGSVVAVDHPVTGTIIVGVAIVLFVGDLSGRLPLLRRLTPERASQTVVAPAPAAQSAAASGGSRARRRRAAASATDQTTGASPAAAVHQGSSGAQRGTADFPAPGAAAALPPGTPAATRPRRAKAAARALAETASRDTDPEPPAAPAAARPTPAPRVTLLLTAAVDTPRLGAGERGGFAVAQAQVRRVLGGMLPGPSGWTLIALLVLIVVAAARVAGADGTGAGVLALLPTAVLIVLFGHFLDAALQTAGPGANADASAVAAVLAVAQELDRDPPHALRVEVILAGCGGALAAGMRREVRALRRGGLRAEQVAVVHLHPCGAGTPAWWTREGMVLALRYHPRLRALAAEVAAARPELQARSHESRGTSGARAARALRWPAIAVGAIDARGVAPRAGGEQDTGDAIDPEALAATVAFTVALIRRLDDDLARS
jgi:hypothetical protein